jgi:hypothetical protein
MEHLTQHEDTPIQTGDLVFFESGTPLYSRAISFGQGLFFDKEDARYSHVGIAFPHEGEYTIIEMLDNGVVTGHPGGRPHKTLPIDATEVDREQIADFLECIISEKRPYGWITILSITAMLWVSLMFRYLLGRMPKRWIALQLGGTSICSGAAAEALTRAGYIFGREPPSMMPADLHKMLRLGVKDYREL